MSSPTIKTPNGNSFAASLNISTLTEYCNNNHKYHYLRSLFKESINEKIQNRQVLLHIYIYL